MTSPTTPVTGVADHLLHLLRDAVNRAEQLPSEAFGGACYRDAAEHAVALDRYLTLGGTPPTDWSRDRR